MAARESSSFLWILVVIVAGLVVAVIAGMTYVPPYFANREVMTAVQDVLDKADPTTDDDRLIGQMNEFLTSTKTARYWVENNSQRQAVDFQLTSDMITFTRNGNQQLSADVSYTQDMWVPLLGREQPITYSFHLDGPTH